MIGWLVAHAATPAAGGPLSWVDRDTARELARRELAKPSYEREAPLLARVLRWVGEQLDWLLDEVGQVVPGAVTAVVVGVVVAAVVIGIVTRGGLRRRRRSPAVFAGTRRSAADHVGAADAAAGRGDWNTAVVQRFRAVVVALEDRQVLAPARGQTAREVAAAAGGVLPDLSAPLACAAARFDAVRYGRQPATMADDAALRELFGTVASARPRTDEVTVAPPVASIR